MLCHVLIFYDSMDCSLAGFSVHGIPQARILEWVAISSSRGSSHIRDIKPESPALQADSSMLSHRNSDKFTSEKWISKVEQGIQGMSLNLRLNITVREGFRKKVTLHERPEEVKEKSMWHLGQGHPYQRGAGAKTLRKYGFRMSDGWNWASEGRLVGRKIIRGQIKQDALRYCKLLWATLTFTLSLVDSSLRVLRNKWPVTLVLAVSLQLLYWDLTLVGRQFGKQVQEVLWKVTSVIQGEDSSALDPRDRSQGSDKWSDFEYNFNMWDWENLIDWMWSKRWKCG